MKYLLGFAALLAGLWFGEWFPDIDQKPNLQLLHRSMVTHGPLVPVVIFAIASGSRSIQLRWFALGVLVGAAIHFSFDLFPGRWSGPALISLPNYGWTASWFSWTWIAGSTLACTWLALRLVRSGFDGSLFVLSFTGMFSYTSVDEEALWRPVVALTIVVLVSLTPAIRRAASSD